MRRMKILQGEDVRRDREVGYNAFDKRVRVVDAG